MKNLSESCPTIDFADFMQSALYDPQNGYYHQNKQIIGEQGDFITAPEISSLFSQCLANALVVYAKKIAQSMDALAILELGAGNGTMAYDVLIHLAEMGSLPKKYQILELSAALKLRQQQKLKQLPGTIFERLSWIDKLPSIPAPRIIVANEVVDSLPYSIGVTRHVKDKWQWHPKRVQLVNNKFGWCEAKSVDLPFEIDVDFCVQDRVMEIPRHLSAWLKSLLLTTSPGLLVVLDYADYDRILRLTHPEGTLRCYHKHTVHDNPFVNVGAQDITYHLNIDLFLRQAKRADWTLQELSTQGHFLINNGLKDIDLSQESDKRRWELSSQIQQLTLPTGLGECYKVMVLRSEKTGE